MKVSEDINNHTNVQRQRYGNNNGAGISHNKPWNVSSSNFLGGGLCESSFSVKKVVRYAWKFHRKGRFDVHRILPHWHDAFKDICDSVAVISSVIGWNQDKYAWHRCYGSCLAVWLVVVWTGVRSTQLENTKLYRGGLIRGAVLITAVWLFG